MLVGGKMPCTGQAHMHVSLADEHLVYAVGPDTDDFCLRRLVLQFFKQASSPLDWLLAQQADAAHTGTTSEATALAAVRALQLAPALADVWNVSLWFQLLPHPSPVVRWCALQGIAGMLQLVSTARLEEAATAVTCQVATVTACHWLCSSAQTAPL